MGLAFPGGTIRGPIPGFGVVKIWIWIRTTYLRSLHVRYQKLFPANNSNPEVFLFRVSHAEPTTHCSLRHRLDDVLAIKSKDGS